MFFFKEYITFDMKIITYVGSLVICYSRTVVLKKEYSGEKTKRKHSSFETENVVESERRKIPTKDV